jgi:hypothetical protein
LSHGWGSAGIVEMLQTLLGVTVTGAGGSQVLVKPPADGLTHASGTQWTERGPVSVSWSEGAHGVSLEVDIPVNVTAVIDIGGHSYTVGSGHRHFGSPSNGK